MKKIVLASAAAAALIAGVSAAAAGDPGAAKYFHERGNFDASMQQRGPAPDLAGWPAEYGYAPAPYGYGQAMGYAPDYGYDYDE